MGSRTGVIQYSAADRGRKFRGQERNFDTAVLASIINGGEVQERVSHGDMLGYYGHWPRVEFGMNPAEGGIKQGRVVAVEPAIRVRSLSADASGLISHDTEFLDTPTGKAAERLYHSKAGGFSSAIDISRRGDKSVPTGFYGFDYVLEPNFTKNRGYALDGVSEFVFDGTCAYNELVESTNRMFDSIQGQYDTMLEAFERVKLENTELMSMLTSGKVKPEVVLDGLRNVIMGVHRPSRSQAEDFLSERLAGFESPKPEAGGDDKATDDFISRRFR